MKKVCLGFSVLLLGLAFYMPVAKADQAFQIITASPLPNASLANYYSTNITYVYSGDNLICTPIATITGQPPGINLENNVGNSTNLGLVALGGIPTQEGTYTINLVLSDSCGSSLVQNFKLTVVSYVAKVVTPGVSASIGSVYSASLAFQYFGTSTPAIVISGTPPGITAGNPVSSPTQLGGVSGSSYTAALSGTPTQAGSYNISVTVTDPTESTTLTWPMSIATNPYLSASPQPTTTPTPTATPTAPITQTTTPTNGQATIGTDPVGTNISSNGTVYMITADGQKRPYTSAGAFLSYGFNTWATVVPASSADLALPTGNFIPPRDGKIICSNKGTDKGTCYLITDSQKAAFTSAAVFTGLGFSFSNTLSGDVSFLPSATNISSVSQPHPAGVLVNKGGTIYLVGDNGLLGIPDMTTLTSWGYSLTDSVKANAADSSFSQSGVMTAHTAGALSPLGK